MNKQWAAALILILSYAGSHVQGTTKNGRAAIALFPFDERDAVCGS